MWTTLFSCLLAVLKACETKFWSNRNSIFQISMATGPGRARRLLDSDSDLEDDDDDGVFFSHFTVLCKNIVNMHRLHDVLQFF